MALKGTDHLVKCREYENIQLKQFYLDILADDSKNE